MHNQEMAAVKYVQGVKSFYSHLIQYGVIVGLLMTANILLSPSYLWALWPAAGWGIGIVMHGINTFDGFNLFGKEWEQRQVEKRLAKQRR